MDNIRIRYILKGCAVCGGDMYLDQFSQELECLQCGRTLNTRTDEEQAALRKEASRRTRPARLPA